MWTRGVDHALYRPRPADAVDLPRPIFLSVGRVAVEKNLEALLELKLPGSVVIVGDGPARAMLERRYPHAHFLGALYGEALAQIYASADAFVFPSKTDTFGIVLIEALASGLPVAAFPVAGPLDVIGESGAGVARPTILARHAWPPSKFRASGRASIRFVSPGAKARGNSSSTSRRAGRPSTRRSARPPEGLGRPRRPGEPSKIAAPASGVSLSPHP